MSGPALHQRHAHSAIHEAAYGEAEELTNLLQDLLLQQDHQKAVQIVSLLIEHWMTRTLRHAEEEEVGLYEEILAKDKEILPLIVSLKRDHQLLRIALDDVKGMLSRIDETAINANQTEVLLSILERFKVLLWLNQVHSRTEEQTLLG